jgi:hypothetical protein
MCYTGGMAYRVRHVFTNKYDEIDRHETKVGEALSEIGEAEIYSIQHTLAQAGSNASYTILSTLIVYRSYED